MTTFTSSGKRDARHIILWVATIAMIAAAAEAWGQTSKATSGSVAPRSAALAVSLHSTARRQPWAPRSDGNSTGT
jgi:hypothetical protein